MDTQYKKLKTIIKQMFQMDQADLDFEDQKRRASGKAYLPKIKSHIWGKI